MKESIILAKDLTQVPPLREKFSRLMVENSFSEKKAFEASLIIDELANNAIEHGSDDQILLEIEISADQAIITCENGVKDSNINAESLKKIISDYKLDQNLRGRGLSKLVPHYASSLSITDVPPSRIRISAILVNQSIPNPNP